MSHLSVQGNPFTAAEVITLQALAAGGSVSPVWGAISGTLSDQTDLQTALNNKQPLDTQLTDLSSLSYAGNALKIIRVNAGENGWELAVDAGGTIDGSGTTNELPYWVDSNTLGALAVATYPSLTELSYVKGVTSAIQTQLNGKAASLSGTINEIAYFNSASTIASLAVATYPSLTELSYVKGVTSAIQTQLGGKATTALDNLSSVAINAALVLGTSDAFALGSTTKQWSDLFLAEGGVINWDNGDVTLTQSGNNLMVSGGIFAFADQVPTTVLGSERVIFEDATGANSDWTFRVAGAGNATIALAASRGTLASPSAGFDDDIVGELCSYGHSGSAYEKAAAIEFRIDGTPGVNDMPGKIIFATTNVGEDFVTQRVVIDSAGVMGPVTSNGVSLGSTARQWSDLFLAEGAVINWDNGDATLTQVGNVVTLAGADLKVSSPGNVSTSVLTTDATQTLTNKTLTSPTLTTPSAFTTGGTITLAENTSIALDPAGSADGKYSGITVTGTAGYTQAFGDLVYLDPTDSRWEAADANAAAAADGDSRGILGMVVSTGTDGTACTILLQGIIRADANFPALTINAPVYVAETAGDIVVTQPVTADVVIRVVGFAITADEIFFNPSPDYITHT